MDQIVQQTPAAELGVEPHLVLVEKARAELYGRRSVSSRAADDTMVGMRAGRIGLGATQGWQPLPSWQAGRDRLAAAPPGSAMVALIARHRRSGHAVLAYHSSDRGVVWYSVRSWDGAVLVSVLTQMPEDSPTSIRVLLLNPIGTEIPNPFGDFRESSSTVSATTDRPLDNRYGGEDQ
jgi:hypothetical protein